MPFLVSDAVPAGDLAPVKYLVTIDGVESESSPAVAADGSVRLHYDLSGVGQGPHTTAVKAVNQWGQSTPTDFSFESAAPAAPTGLRIEF